MKNLIPVVMAGVLGIYGLIISITINLRLHITNMKTTWDRLTLQVAWHVALVVWAQGWRLGLLEMQAYVLMVNSRNCSSRTFSY